MRWRLMTVPRGRSGGSADLSCHGRRARALPQIQVRSGRVGLACAISVWRGRPQPVIPITAKRLAKRVLQIGLRSGHARTGHCHHPAINLDPVAVRVEEIEGVAATAAAEFLAAFRTVDIRTGHDLDATRADMIEGQQPILARVDFKSDVIDAGALANAGIRKCDAGFPCVISGSSNNTTSWCLSLMRIKQIGRPKSGGTQCPVTLRPSTLR